MTGYRFDVDCAECGGELQHVNGAAPTGSHAVAVAECKGCRRQWLVQVFLRPFPRDGRAAARKRAQRAA